MVFYPPAHERMVREAPDSITVEQFMLDERHGRRPLDKSLDPYTCALSGKSYSATQVKERVEHLARGLGKELGWDANKGSEYDKVSCIYSLNSIDHLPVYWAIHKLGGIATPANAGYNASELEYQLKVSNATSVFTSAVNLPTALEAVEKVGIAKNRIYIMTLPTQALGSKSAPGEFRTVDDMIAEGSKQQPIEPVKLQKGEGATRTAFLCFSSGTSGLPKAVKISHQNIIANVLSMYSQDLRYRASRTQSGKAEDVLERKLGLLPMSHIYGLIIVGHQGAYSGDQTLVLPAFKMETMLQTIQQYKLTTLYLVPPIIIAVTRNKELVGKHDLSSVNCVMTGAAPLGKEVAEEVIRMFPRWLLRQAYGMTETSTAVLFTAYDDIVDGSTGCILPGISVKIVDPETQKEVTGYERRGELWVRGPSNALGYLNNEKATQETFVRDSEGYWVRTGDEVMVTKSKKGTEHFWIVDRIKELIKVKGHQVAPAELEAHLLSHPAVADCAVIPIPDDRAGERPKAYVVKSKSVGLEDNDRMVAREIRKYVEKHKSDYKWIKEVEFIDVIPKSPSGKILRRMLRDKDKAARKKAGAKL